MRRNPLPISVAAFLAFTLSSLPADAATPIRYRPLTPAQLDQLTAPIALYPDPLLNSVLAASTLPLDLVIAAQWLRDNPTPTEDLIAAQPWDPSIRTLVHYPSVLQSLADNLAWTRQLGLAYANQPADVTKSIQRLRAKARAIGTLTNTPEQNILIENHYIQIQPALPEIIYVPVYNPAVCFTHRRPPHFEKPNTPPSTPAPVDTPPANTPTTTVRTQPTLAPPDPIESIDTRGQHTTITPPAQSPTISPATPAAPTPPTAAPPAATPPTPQTTESTATVQPTPQQPTRQETFTPSPIQDSRRPSIDR